MGEHFSFKVGELFCLNKDDLIFSLSLESFIQNFSVLYSPLKRHLTGSDSAQFPSQHLITEVTTDTFWEVTLRKQVWDWRDEFMVEHLSITRP